MTVSSMAKQSTHVREANVPFGMMIVVVTVKALLDRSAAASTLPHVTTRSRENGKARN